jgi:hypothetical protein
VSAGYYRGGLPVHINRSTADDTPEKWMVVNKGGRTNRLLFRNSGMVPITIYFTDAAKDADTGYPVDVGQALDVPVEVGWFWTRSPLGVGAFEALAFVIRG